MRYSVVKALLMDVKLFTFNVKSIEVVKAQLDRISWASGEVRIEIQSDFLTLVYKIGENLSKGPISETASRRIRRNHNRVNRLPIYGDFLYPKHDLTSDLEVAGIPHI